MPFSLILELFLYFIISFSITKPEHFPVEINIKTDALITLSASCKIYNLGYKTLKGWLDKI